MSVFSWTHVDPIEGCVQVSITRDEDGHIVLITKNGHPVPLGSPESAPLMHELRALEGTKSYLVSKSRTTTFYRYVDAKSSDAAIVVAENNPYGDYGWSSGKLENFEYLVTERPEGGWDWER